MLRRFSTNFAIFSIGIDALTIAFFLWFTARIRPFLGDVLGETSIIKDINRPLSLPLALYFLFSITWVLIMLSFSVYDGRKNIHVVDEFSALTLSSILAGVTMAGELYLSYRELSRAFFIVFVLFAYLFFLSSRVIARTLYWMRNVSAKKVRQVLILGAGIVGREVGARISNHRYLSIELAGFLDDDPVKRAAQPEIIGNIGDARSMVKERHIDSVVIALPLRAYERVNKVILDLQDLPVKIWIVPDYFQITLHHAGVEDFIGIPMLDLRAAALTENQRMVKRAFDIFIGCLMLIFALPIMGLIALAILLDDGRPIIFRQKRVGENGRLFTVYKFRTMVKNAEQIRSLVEQKDENGNILHKRRNDPRVTPVGRVLRRLSLDELPQLVNVMRGTMSLVGPRPELPYLVEKYESWQRKRFAVPQGLTGWWQIHGRSDKPMHLHTEDDLYYVQNYSIFLDVEILIKTIWIIIRGKGAY